MSASNEHAWNVSIAEASALQRRLAQRVRKQTPAHLRRRLNDPELLVGAADISYNRRSPLLYAAILVFRLGDLSLVEQVGRVKEVFFPYVPGYLSFREAPVVLEAYARLRHPPDVLLCDGQGLAHPRRLGLACHLGVILNRPTIGCAKTRLIGEHREPGLGRGCATELCDKGELIGKVLRTRSGVKPIYVSIGHQCALEDALTLVLRCCPRYRIPEPLRQAHQAVNELRESSDTV